MSSEEEMDYLATGKIGKLLESRNLSDISGNFCRMSIQMWSDKLIFHHYQAVRKMTGAQRQKEQKVF